MSDLEQTRDTRILRSRLVHWIAELCLVFIGVYGAFWLNSYQERQHEAQRRDRILATLEESVQKSIKRYEAAAAQQERVAIPHRDLRLHRDLFNRIRLHSSLAYIRPIHFESQLNYPFLTVRENGASPR